MDDRVQAVLDVFHKRLADETDLRNSMSRAEWRDYVDQDALLAVGPETGRIINLIVRSMKSPTVLEIGTSFGYSTIWLASAARDVGGRVVSLEIDGRKSAQACEMANRAGLETHIEFRVGDAVALIEVMTEQWDFVLLDLWKDLYTSCFEAFFPALNPNGIIVADNMVQPGGDAIEKYRQRVRATPGMTSVLLPIGTGIEISRWEPDQRNHAIGPHIS